MPSPLKAHLLVDEIGDPSDRVGLDLGRLFWVEIAIVDSFVNPGIHFGDQVIDDGLRIDPVRLGYLSHGSSVSQCLHQVRLRDPDGGGSHIEPGMEATEPTTREVPLICQVGGYRVGLFLRDGSVRH